MEQNNRKICSMCGKKFDMWDEQEDFCFVRHIGYVQKTTGLQGVRIYVHKKIDGRTVRADRV